MYSNQCGVLQISYPIIEYIPAFDIDNFLILGLLISFLFKRSRDFIKDWVPFILLWITYDMMRGIADNLNEVHVSEIYYLELHLFGWMFGGEVPPIWAQQHQHIVVSTIAALFYTMHMGVPIFVGGLIYYVSDDREFFKEFTFAFILTSYLALLTFVIYPVAPPWYVADYGFVPPDQRMGLAESAAGLISVDKFFNNNFYGSIYRTFNSNAFAALPSLHSGYSYISALYFTKKYKHKGKKVYLSFMYPMGVWFSAVYLNHHYIVDLIAGVIYVHVSIYIAKKYREYRKNKQENKEASTEPDEGLIPVEIDQQVPTNGDPETNQKSGKKESLLEQLGD